MSEADIFVEIRLSADEFQRSLQKLVSLMAPLQDILKRMVRDMRRAMRGHRTSGHRHRGTRDWALRYASGRKDVSLGQRTLAKRRATA